MITYDTKTNKIYNDNNQIGIYYRNCVIANDYESNYKILFDWIRNEIKKTILIDWSKKPSENYSGYHKGYIHLLLN